MRTVIAAVMTEWQASSAMLQLVNENTPTVRGDSVILCLAAAPPAGRLAAAFAFGAGALVGVAAALPPLFCLIKSSASSRLSRPFITHLRQQAESSQALVMWASIDGI